MSVFDAIKRKPVISAVPSEYFTKLATAYQKIMIDIQ